MATYADAIREAYELNNSKTIVLNTLEFRHPSFIDSESNKEIAIRVVCDEYDLRATLESTAPINANEVVTFSRCSFELVLPSYNTKKVNFLTLTVDNVDEAMSQYLSQACRSGYPLKVIYRPYLLNSDSPVNPDTILPQMNDPYEFFVASASVTETAISLKCVFENQVKKQAFPKGTYDLGIFKGLL